MLKKTLKVIPEKCIACGACVSICPKSFKLDESDINAVSQAIDPPKDKDEDIALAIDACPTDAIVYK